MTYLTLIGIGLGISVISCLHLISCAFQGILREHFLSHQSGEELLYFAGSWMFTINAAALPLWLYIITLLQ